MDVFSEINQVITIIMTSLASEDLAFFYGLFAIQNESFSLFSFIFAYVVGVLIGDVGLFWIGRNMKRFSFLKRYLIFEKFTNKWVREGRFDYWLILTRFIPGTRIPTYVYSGASGYPILKFLTILFLASFVYSLCGALIVINMKMLGADTVKVKLVVAFSASLLTISLFRLLTVLLKMKQMYKEVLRPLSIVISRQRFPEFWKSWCLYLPFVPIFIYFFIRYRGLKTILSANPMIKMSGLIGELKSEIDVLLVKYVPIHRLATFDLGEKSSFCKARQVIDENALTYPIVVKPDSGMRGTDVSVIRTEDDLEKTLKDSNKKMILQEFTPYENEWGVLYYRYPGQTKGRVYSVTVKERPVVVGDGKKNIYKLILDNKVYKRRFDWIASGLNRPLDEIPFDGEKVVLVQRGSHSKGCIFRDGRQWLKSDVLEQVKIALDKIEGFHIGRVDLKFDNIDGLRNGSFKIVEINGVGGESSNFYDPHVKILDVYKIMTGQWRHIFKIGNENRKKGFVTDETYYTFFKEVLSY